MFPTLPRPVGAPYFSCLRARDFIDTAVHQPQFYTRHSRELYTELYSFSSFATMCYPAITRYTFSVEGVARSDLVPSTYLRENPPTQALLNPETSDTLPSACTASCALGGAARRPVTTHVRHVLDAPSLPGVHGCSTMSRAVRHRDHHALRPARGMERRSVPRPRYV